MTATNMCYKKSIFGKKRYSPLDYIRATMEFIVITFERRRQLNPAVIANTAMPAHTAKQSYTAMPMLRTRCETKCTYENMAESD